MPEFEPLLPPTAPSESPVPARPAAPVDPLIAIAARIETMRPAVDPASTIGAIMGKAAIAAVVIILAGGLLIGIDPLRVVVAAAATGVLLVFAAELLIGFATAGTKRRPAPGTSAAAERDAQRRRMAQAVGLIEAEPVVDPKAAAKAEKEAKTAAAEAAKKGVKDGQAKAEATKESRA